MQESLKGRLLVASVSLLDPNFFRAVVLICAHDDDGAFGVVINRPSDARVADFLPDWAPVTATPDVVFVGGPVSPEVAVGVAETSGLRPQSEAWTAVLGPVGMIDLGTPPDDLSVSRARVFSGYSGWGMGQLETEIGRGDWIVVDSAPGDGFAADPETLWNRVLRRQPGRLALLSTFPPDPRLN